MSHSHPPHETHTLEEFHQTLHEHDDWFRPLPGGPRHQEAHGGTSAGIIIGFLIGTLVFVGVTSYAVYYLWNGLADAQVVALQEHRTPLGPLLSAQAEWEGQLSRFEYTEGIAGSVAVAKVPLNVAKRLVIEDYQKNAPKN